MGFMVQFEEEAFGDLVRAVVKAAESLLHEGDRVTGHRRNVGRRVAALMSFDKAVDAYLRRGGEGTEGDYTDYYYLKAVAAGMAGDTAKGQEYYKKAKAKRSGGKYAEWGQDFNYR